jgi:translation initiation factor 1
VDQNFILRRKTSMSKKKRSDRFVVFSTDPDFEPAETEPDGASSPPFEQQIRVHLDRKGRRGKAVTLIRGFEGSQDEADKLLRTLKKMCGVGGSAKDGDLLLQGDHRDKVVQFMREKGYKDTKKSGG